MDGKIGNENMKNVDMDRKKEIQINHAINTDIHMESYTQINRNEGV